MVALPRGEAGFLTRIRSSTWALASACAAVAALSLLFPSTPTYDPWSWLVWGGEVAALDLDTSAGPAWKPLPVAFTTAFAPLGDAAPALWLVVARAGSLLALLLAGRLAFRLAGGAIPGALAAAVAVAGTGLSAGWIRSGLLGNAEGILVALVLWAVERHLDGARTQAVALGVAAALVRPELWPFLAVYAGYVWLADPQARRRVAALCALVPVAWFGPELWGSGDLLRASERARELPPGDPAAADRPALEILELAHALVPAPVDVGFGLALAAAAVGVARRRAVTVTAVLAVAALAWVAVVAALTELGYAGNPRYLLPASAVGAVVAGVGWAALVHRVAGLAGSRPLVASAAALAVAAAAAPFFAPGVEEAADTVEAARSQARLYEALPVAIERAGGRERILACGDPYTGDFRVPLLAWHLRMHLGDVGTQDEVVHPAVVFHARGTPPLDERRFPLEALARAGEWTVAATCDSTILPR